MPEIKTMRSRCNLAMALEAEARPVISHYGLKKLATETAWPVYSNDELSLVITGLGKTSAAAACAWLQAQHPAPVWLNLGIAGHETADIGSHWLANRIRDNATGECWYPQTTLLPGFRSKPLLTVDRPAEYESADELYDMEASGFISTCARFTTLEWIHVFKIVSDNRDSHWQQLDRNKVPGLVTSALPGIDLLIQTLAEQYPVYHPQAFDTDLFDKIVSLHHFTVTRRNELAQLLTRCRVLDCCPDIQQLQNQENAHAVIAMLSGSITNAAQQQLMSDHG